MQKNYSVRHLLYFLHFLLLATCHQQTSQYVCVCECICLCVCHYCLCLCNCKSHCNSGLIEKLAACRQPTSFRQTFSAFSPIYHPPILLLVLLVWQQLRSRWLQYCANIPLHWIFTQYSTALKYCANIPPNQNIVQIFYCIKILCITPCTCATLQLANIAILVEIEVDQLVNHNELDAMQFSNCAIFSSSHDVQSIISGENATLWCRFCCVRLDSGFCILRVYHKVNNNAKEL